MSIKANIEAILPSYFRSLLARIEASPLGYRLARGAFWSIAGAVTARGLGLISSILVARMLGKTGFGELGIIQSTVGMFGTFAGFGLGMTATKFIAQYRRTDPEKAGHIRALSSSFAWVTSSVTSLVFFFMAPWLAEHTLAAPHLAGLLQIGVLFLLLNAVNGAQIGALSGFEAFKTVAKISLFSGLINFPFMVGGVYYAGLTGAAWGMVIASAVNWMLNHIAIRKECAKAGVPYTYEGCWTEKAVLWKFALPAVVSSMFFAPTEWILNAMLVNQPGGYGQMGIFNAAKQWHILILYLPNMLSGMTLPILSNLLGENEKEKYKKMLVMNSLAFFAIALVVAIPVSIFSQTIMSSYGKDFNGEWQVLVLISAYSVLWASHIVVGQAMWSTGATREAMIFAAIRSFILILSGALLVKYGAVGLSLALLITYIIQTLYLIPYVKYKTDRYFAVAESENMKMAEPLCQLLRSK